MRNTLAIALIVAVISSGVTFVATKKLIYRKLEWESLNASNPMHARNSANEEYPCGALPLPIKLNEGNYFVSEELILAMGGDLNKPIYWRGKINKWKPREAEFFVYDGSRGVLVSGTGPGFMRWNLYQEGRGFNGWLDIRKAYKDFANPNCKAIYSSGKILSDGSDPGSADPAFAETR